MVSVAAPAWVNAHPPRQTRQELSLNISVILDIREALSETDMLNMFKALANHTRLQIMEWLADPQAAFAGLCKDGEPGLPGWGGACVGTVQRKFGISQLVVSGFQKFMLQAGLLEAKRH